MTAMPTIAAALGLVAAVQVSGSSDAVSQTLQLMGFDPDRAALITALLVGGLAAAAGALAGGRKGLPVLLGAFAAFLLFGPTFVAETRSAMAATGAAGTFDPIGWLLTLITLLTSAAVSAWAGMTLALEVRAAMLRAWPDISGGLRAPELRPRALRAALPVVLIAALLIVSVPVFGDMVNFSPDARMFQGGSGFVGLAGPQDQPGVTPSGAAGSQAPAPTGIAVPAGPFGSAARPWLAWLPKGSGTVATAHLAPYWKNAGSAQSVIDIYTPPGYSTSRHYPVIYEAPWGIAAWTKGVIVTSVLDGLIDRGRIPPVIVVFMNAGSGPYPDSECANSYDGRQWFDSYVAQTVVPWVDAHYSTIREASARTTMGMSQGGYCAAILALHHPDLFSSVISMSGYYQAGIFGTTASYIFGNNPSFIAADSPDVVVNDLPPATRARLGFVIVADPAQPLYGPQAAAFDKQLLADGYPYVFIPATLTHGWYQVRETLPQALADWASRQAATTF